MPVKPIKGVSINNFINIEKDFVQKLRSIKTSDPKSYWSMLNKATSSNHSKAMQKNSLGLFAENFKKLKTVSIVNRTIIQILILKISVILIFL